MHLAHSIIKGHFLWHLPAFEYEYFVDLCFCWFIRSLSGNVGSVTIGLLVHGFVNLVVISLDTCIQCTKYTISKTKATVSSAFLVLFLAQHSENTVSKPFHVYTFFVILSCPKDLAVKTNTIKHRISLLYYSVPFSCIAISLFILYRTYICQVKNVGSSFRVEKFNKIAFLFFYFLSLCSLSLTICNQHFSIC